MARLPLSMRNRAEERDVAIAINTIVERKEMPCALTIGGGTVRYAPSFRVAGDKGESGRHDSPYTAETLAKFLGWNKSKVDVILHSLSVRCLASLAAMGRKRLPVAKMTTFG